MKYATSLAIRHGSLDSRNFTKHRHRRDTDRCRRRPSPLKRPSEPGQARCNLLINEIKIISSTPMIQFNGTNGSSSRSSQQSRGSTAPSSFMEQPNRVGFMSFDGQHKTEGISTVPSLYDGLWASGAHDERAIV